MKTKSFLRLLHEGVLDDYDVKNSGKTQIANTIQTYRAAHAYLDKIGAPEGATLDFGAGMGLGSKEFGFDSFEPNPDGWEPKFNSPDDIPDGTYPRIVCMYVLNVVSPHIRNDICGQIRSKLSPDGVALIIVRGADVLNAKGEPGDEPMSIMTTMGTYQKGFRPKEFRDYLAVCFGDEFTVARAPIGTVGAIVKRAG